MFFQDILEDEIEKARDKALTEGRAEERSNAVIAFYKNRVSIETIAKSLNMNVDEVKQIITEHKE